MSMKFTRCVICLIVLLTQSINLTYAQDGAGGGVSDEILGDTKTDIITVVALGGTGAILGLSTLSFVEEPSEHLRNILVGGAVGIIIGVGVVAWMQATKSQKSFATHPQELDPKEFSTVHRVAWHENTHRLVNAKLDTAKSNQVLNFNFSF